MHDVCINDFAHTPVNTKDNKNVIITSKHRFDATIMAILHCMFAGCTKPQSTPMKNTQSVSFAGVLYIIVMGLALVRASGLL